jgi:coenzyme F420 hydrogenase subunit beta
VTLNIGLLCSEVFTFEGLMRDAIEGEMGLALADIAKFNVKGKVLIDTRAGERLEINLKQAQQYARPECHHCGDFSAELADLSCGGVGATDWTIVVLRTPRGEALFDRAAADGVFEVRPMNEFETSMKVLLRLARKQRQRVPVPPGRDETFVRPAGFTNPH